MFELVITVGIVGILAAIAYSTYTDSMRKGRRAEGRAALADLMLQQERYMTQRNCYVTFTTNSEGVTTPTSSCGGVAIATVPMKAFSGENARSSAYLLAAQTCPAEGGGAAPAIDECVMLVATPTRPDPDVGNLTLTSTGRRACTGDVGPTSRICWP